MKPISMMRSHGDCSFLSCTFTVIASFALAAWFATPVQAGMVQLEQGGNDSGWSAEWHPDFDPFVEVQVDNILSDRVIIQKSAEFLQPPSNGVFPPVVITFKQTKADAVKYIVINDEILTNSTGSPWFDFHMELIDMGDAWFNEALSDASAGGTGFNIVPFQQYDFNSGPQPKNFDVWDGMIPDGGTWFPGDGPFDGELFIETVTGAGTLQDPFTVFSLKEFPTVPEPSSILLMLLGAGLVNCARRRRF